jgi:hypothetical protein
MREDGYNDGVPAHEEEHHSDETVLERNAQQDLADTYGVRPPNPDTSGNW